MNYFCAFCGKKIVLGYIRYLQMIEYLMISSYFLFSRGTKATSTQKREFRIPVE
jgi:hypothetical protein